MVENIYSKIIVGTGTSTFLTQDKSKDTIGTLEYSLKKGCGVHISPTYSNTFSKLSKIDLYKYTDSKVISKIDFDKQSNPELQLELTSNLLKKRSFDVQILIDFTKYFLNKESNWYDFEKELIYYKNKYSISEFYLFPYYFDSEIFIDIIKDSKLNFNFALLYSLLDREFKNLILDERKNGSKILAIKGFGGSLSNKYLNENKSKSSCLHPINKSIDDLSRNLKLDEAKLRLIFSLKNPNIDFSCIAFSNYYQANEAFSIIEKNFSPEIIDSIITFGQRSYFEHKTALPEPRKIKKRFVNNHSFQSIFISCWRIDQRILSIKIISYSFCRNILKTLRILKTKLNLKY
tara:strand:+ start:5652 stop:6692 length:1041 start_codon:yes stop_codon:yes gene_type:complete